MEVMSLLMLLLVAVIAAAALFKPAFALSANANLNRFTDQEVCEWPVAAAVRIFRDAYVGLDPAGMLKPFEPGDVFVGIAYEECNNTSGAAAAVKCRVRTTGDWSLTVASVAETDAGKPVFATADDALAMTGHPDGYVGRILAKLDTNTALVRLKAPGDLPMSGCVLIDIDFSKLTFAPVLTAGGEQFIGGILRMDAIGAGIAAVGIAPDPATGEVRMLLDNDNEAENLTIETPCVCDITKGITFEMEGRLKTAGGAATDDVDFGIATTLSDTERANMNATTSGLKSCLFHLDANANDIFVSSDDDASPVAAADTGVDNSLTVNKKHRITARPGGACQVWIDGVRKLASTAFSVSATGKFGGVVNLEKSTGTGVPEVRIARMRLAGAAA